MPFRKSLLLKNVGLGEKVTKSFLPTPKISQKILSLHLSHVS